MIHYVRHWDTFFKGVLHVNGCCRYYNRHVLLLREKQEALKPDPDMMIIEEVPTQNGGLKLESMLNYLGLYSELESDNDEVFNNIPLKSDREVMGKELLVDELGFQLWRIGIVQFLNDKYPDVLLDTLCKTLEKLRLKEKGSLKLMSPQLEAIRSVIFSIYASFQKKDSGNSYLQAGNFLQLFEEKLLMALSNTYRHKFSALLFSLSFQDYCRQLFDQFSSELALLNFIYDPTVLPDLISKSMTQLGLVAITENRSLFEEHLGLAFKGHQMKEIDGLVRVLSHSCCQITGNEIMETQYEDYLKNWFSAILTLVHGPRDELENFQDLLKEYLWHEQLFTGHFKHRENLKKIFEKYFSLALNGSKYQGVQCLLTGVPIATATLLRDPPLAFAKLYDKLLTELGQAHFSRKVTEEESNDEFKECQLMIKKWNDHTIGTNSLSLTKPAGTPTKETELLLSYLNMFNHLGDKDIFLKSYSEYLSQRLLSYCRKCLADPQGKQHILKNGTILLWESWLIYSFHTVCGYEFVHKLNTMFKDFCGTLIDTRTEVVDGNSFIGNAVTTSSKGQFLVGTFGAWPNTKATKSVAHSNPILQVELERFESSWKQQNPKKKLLFLEETFSFDLSLFNGLLELREVDWSTFNLLSILIYKVTPGQGVTMSHASVALDQVAKSLQTVDPNWDNEFLGELLKFLDNIIYTDSNGNIRLKQVQGVLTLGSFIPQPKSVTPMEVLLETRDTRPCGGLDRQALVEAFIVRFLKCQQSAGNRPVSHLPGNQTVSGRGISKVALVNSVQTAGFKAFIPDIELIETAIELLIKKGFIEVLPKSSFHHETRFIYLS